MVIIQCLKIILLLRFLTSCRNCANRTGRLQYVSCLMKIPSIVRGCFYINELDLAKCQRIVNDYSSDKCSSSFHRRVLAGIKRYRTWHRLYGVYN